MSLPISPSAMRLFLLLCIVGMQALAAFFLRSRRMTFSGYLAWGLFAALLPILGPFLAILLKPGRPAYRTARSRRAPFQLPTTLADLRRIAAARFRLTKP